MSHDDKRNARLTLGAALYLAHLWGGDPARAVGEGPYALDEDQLEVVNALLQAARALDPDVRGDLHVLSRDHGEA